MKRLFTIIFLVALFFSVACATPLEQANKASKEVGKTGGQVARIPHSASEGIAEGIAGEEDSNPYNR